MSYEQNPGIITQVAGADMSSDQYLIAKLGSADNTVIRATGVTAPLLGVVTRPGASGSAVAIRTHGVAKVKAGATVTRGGFVGCNASGQAINYVIPGAAATNYYLGIALEDGASGEIISVLLQPGVNTGT